MNCPICKKRMAKSFGAKRCYSFNHFYGAWFEIGINLVFYKRNIYFEEVHFYNKFGGNSLKAIINKNILTVIDNNDERYEIPSFGYICNMKNFNKDKFIEKVKIYMMFV